MPNGNKYVLPFIDVSKGVRKGIIVYAPRRLNYEWCSLDDSGTTLLAFFCNGIERLGPVQCDCSNSIGNVNCNGAHESVNTIGELGMVVENKILLPQETLCVRH